MLQLTFDALIEMIFSAAWETLQMVAVAGLLTLLFGLPIALLLIVTGRGGVCEAPGLHRIVGWTVNAFRSTPFIILLVALIPVTRLLVGTSIGLWAAVVPITVAATPYFARIAKWGCGRSTPVSSKPQKPWVRATGRSYGMCSCPRACRQLLADLR